MKTCTRCLCRLPLRKFQIRRGGLDRQAVCSLCLNSDRRLRDPLPAVKRDPREVHILNVTNLWFGPVRREPMRSIA